MAVLDGTADIPSNALSGIVSASTILLYLLGCSVLKSILPLGGGNHETRKKLR